MTRERELICIPEPGRPPGFINVVVARDGGKVILEFSECLTLLSMSPEAALEMATLLTAQAALA